MVIPSTIYDQKRIVSSTNSNCSCPYVKCCDSDTDDGTNKYLKNNKNLSGPIPNKECHENLTSNPDLSSSKPKGILVLHESEDGLDKKSKANRTVSFTLDDSKKPFTTSIYYGVKSYLHHFYEPVNKTTMNGDSCIDDDFEFVVEPGMRRNHYWVTATFVLGIIMALGAIYLFAMGPTSGPLPKGMLMDPWQLLGLTMFCSGSFLIICSLLVSAYLSNCGIFKIRDPVPLSLPLQYPPLNEPSRSKWIRYAGAGARPVLLYDNRIPLSEEITAPQMNRSKN